MGWRHAAWGCVLIAGCGPERGEPDPVSVACGTDEPIRLSTRALSPYNFLAIGDDWSLLDIGQAGDTIASETVIFDPCGEGSTEIVEASTVVPAGEGYVRCDVEDAAWALTRDATPVPLPRSTYCMYAELTAHGLLIQDDRDRLHRLTDPSAAPQPVAPAVSVGRGVEGGPKWFTDGDFVWYVTAEFRVERHDLRSGENRVLAEHGSDLTVSPARDAVAWTERAGETDAATAVVHVVATGEMIEVPGAVDGLWPGVLVTTTDDELMVLDLATRGVDRIAVPDWYWVIRADHETRSMIVAVRGPEGRGNTIGRLDLDTATFEAFVDVRSQPQVDVDPHGDGVIVTDPIDDDDDGRDNRARILRISTAGATTLVDDAVDRSSWALAKDGRLLYKRAMADGTASPDLHVRNPDGTEQVFAHDATLVAPQPQRWDPYFVLVARPSPDLEGDVLVNLGVGDAAELWRMPFDTP